jgi:hypothetical protein
MQTQDFINKTIQEYEGNIIYLQNKIKDLKDKQTTLKNDNCIENWLDYEFYSSSGLTEEFASFTKDFKKYLKDNLTKDYELVNFNRGHFYLSGFIKNIQTNKYMYFSTSDVRFFKNEWYNNILVRTAEHEKDYTGGRNLQIPLPDIFGRLVYMTS